MPIVTVTTNPALDVATSVDSVRPTDKLRCTAPLVNAGGGGINVARVARRFGASVIAVLTAGGLAGQRVADLAAAEGLDVKTVPIAGETRQSFTVTQRSDGEQFRFVMPGPPINPGEEAAVARAVAALGRPSFVVHSGSLPADTSPGFLASLCAEARQLGARFVLDGPGEILAGARGAYLIKPNLRELEGMAGRSLPTTDERIAFSREAIANGHADNILVSLGEDGALLVTGEEAIAYNAPEVPLVSAVGAGDSMLGALLAALDDGASLADAVAHGAAAGAAALLTPGTELSDPADARRLLDKVEWHTVTPASHLT
ncbi:1-phosphofructokinase family hexose kinase [Acuticoccus sediminis]|uniref:1-phosphofructokinase family hexose kinase n=1 Tax=Acuticoccus sediminis TaxID=2184697 RepID=UPI001CFD4711|nr:hexose kinase [Acuticoccus sediminis]